MLDPLSEELKKRLKRKDSLAKGLEITRVFAIFEGETSRLLPGEKIIPKSLKNKTLIVEISSAVVASELHLHERILLNTINTFFGKEVVKKVIYRY